MLVVAEISPERIWFEARIMPLSTACLTFRKQVESSRICRRLVIQRIEKWKRRTLKEKEGAMENQSKGKHEHQNVKSLVFMS